MLFTTDLQSNDTKSCQNSSFTKYFDSICRRYFIDRLSLFSGCLDAQQYPIDTKTGPEQNSKIKFTTRRFANPLADVGTFGISALLLHGSRSIAPMHAMNEIWAEEPAPCGRSLDEATAIVAESEAQDEVRFDTGAKIKIHRIF